MNDNQNSISQAKQRQSLMLTREDEWMFGNFPLISQRKESFYSITEVLEDKNSLAIIDKRLGKGASLRWIKAQLLDVLRICGAGNIFNEAQVIFAARRIRNIYYYLTLSELTYFFESFAGGKYGILYVGKTINPQNIFEAMKLYENERNAKISEIESENEKERRKKEQEEIRKGNTGLNAWIKYAKEHNLKDTAPLEGFLKEIKRKSLTNNI